MQRKIALYRARGLIQQFDSESFFDPSWLCMYGNLGIDAESWDPLANLLPIADLAEVTRRVRADIARMAGGATPHREFLELAARSRRCKACLTSLRRLCIRIRKQTCRASRLASRQRNPARPLDPAVDR